MQKHDVEDILVRLEILEKKVDSKRIPLGVLFALVFQTLGAVWWASDISATVNRLQATNVSDLVVKNYIAEREKAYLEMDNHRHLNISERITRVEGNFTHIEKSLTRIEKKLMLLGK